MDTHSVIILILGIVAAIFGLIQAAMAGARPPGGAFWGGLGILAAGLGLIVVAIGP